MAFLLMRSIFFFHEILLVGGLSLDAFVVVEYAISNRWYSTSRLMYMWICRWAILLWYCFATVLEKTIIYSNAYSFIIVSVVHLLEWCIKEENKQQLFYTLGKHWSWCTHIGPTMMRHVFLYGLLLVPDRSSARGNIFYLTTVNQHLYLSINLRFLNSLILNILFVNIVSVNT